MISPIAFKFAAVYLLPYIYMAMHPTSYSGNNIHLTTSYISISNVNSVMEIKLQMINTKFVTKYISNKTHGFVLIDLPPSIGLCPILSLHAPMLSCLDRDTVAMSELYPKLDTTLIRRSFGVQTFAYADRASIEAVIESGYFDYSFMVQSFPSLAVRLMAPVKLVEGNDCGAVNCSIPRYSDFFIDGAKDTAIYLGTHLAIKHIYNPYMAPIVNRWLGPPLRYVSGPFRRWYNNALYAADHLTVRGFEAGMSAAPENIGLSTVSRELAGGLPPYEFVGPTTSVALPGSVQSSVGSQSVHSSFSSFKSPIPSASSSISVSSGASSGIISSSRDAPVLGAVRATPRGYKYPSMPSLPTIGRSSKTLLSLSTQTSDALVQVPLRRTLSGNPVVVNAAKSNNRNILSNLFKVLKRSPKIRRRRQAGVFSRRLAQGFRATGKALERIPSWVGHATVVAVPWILSGMEHLTTLDPTVTVIHPIQRLASYERYFIAMTTLIFCQCFHDAGIRETVLDRHDKEMDIIVISGRNMTPADIIFDLARALPGDTLRECSPFFMNQFVGFSQAILLEILSVHFDVSLVVGDILFYSGPAKYIISDYTAYYNDVFPNFSPYLYSREKSNHDQSLSQVAAYNNHFSRVRRAQRRKRASYTFHGREVSGDRPKSYPSVLFHSESSFTLSVQYLLDTPKLRFEFDILQASHYNTSFSYYQNLRKFASTSSINFNEATSHSSFRVVRGITLVEIMRGMNPFDLYVPRLNIIRELISGYNLMGDLQNLRRASVKMNINLEYASLPSLVGLFYIVQYPTDRVGFNKILNMDVSKDTMRTIGSALYQMRYARVPMLIVAQTDEILSSLRKMFVVHVRVLEDISSWVHYSPVMLTTSITMIPSGAYTMCLSKTRTHTSKYSLFGEESADLGWDSLFTDACDVATIHVTFDNTVSEILENQNMPDRLKSLLTVEANSSYAIPSGGLYDPILSEVINMVEPGHEVELANNIRGSHDEGQILQSGSKRNSNSVSGVSLSIPNHATTIRSVEVTEEASGGPSFRLSSNLVQNEALYADEPAITAHTNPEPPTSYTPTGKSSFFERNSTNIIIGSILLLLLLLTFVVSLSECRRRTRRIETELELAGTCVDTGVAFLPENMACTQDNEIRIGSARNGASPPLVISLGLVDMAATVEP